MSPSSTVRGGQYHTKYVRHSWLTQFGAFSLTMPIYEYDKYSCCCMGGISGIQAEALNTRKKTRAVCCTAVQYDTSPTSRIEHEPAARHPNVPHVVVDTRVYNALLAAGAVLCDQRRSSRV